MTGPYTGTPQLPSLAVQVSDLERRIRVLEGGGGSAGGGGDSVGAFPVSQTALWASTTSTDWVGLWAWYSRLVWATLDFRISQTVSAVGVTANLRIIVDSNVTIWTWENGGTQILEDLASLDQVLSDGSRGTSHRFAIEAKISSVTAGTVSVCPEKLIMVDPI